MHDGHTPTLWHGVAGIDQQIDKDLLHLGWIDINIRQIDPIMTHYLNIVDVRMMRHQGQGTLHDFRHGIESFVRDRSPREIKQPFDNIGTSIGFMDDGQGVFTLVLIKPWIC